jgi:hypothetical protein
VPVWPCATVCVRVRVRVHVIYAAILLWCKAGAAAQRAPFPLLACHARAAPPARSPRTSINRSFWFYFLLPPALGGAPCGMNLGKPYLETEK